MSLITLGAGKKVDLAGEFRRGRARLRLSWLGKVGYSLVDVQVIVVFG